MYLLGLDIGTSFVKVSVVDSQTQKCICSTQYPESEATIISLQSGWAEQSPESWWEYVQQAILKANASGVYDPKDIAAIGIAYQMHGLVCVDKEGNVLRNSIIWCDSRAVELGNEAFEAIGPSLCQQHLLNSPGNFTASKLAWVKKYEPLVYAKIDKIMLPGDFISMKLTGRITTSISSLSEGIFWDFLENELSKDLFDYFGFPTSLIPDIQPVFSEHGRLHNEAANLLNLKKGTPVSYKAGDQPNNALSLNVLEPGEVAATAGTSGVIFGISDQLSFDPLSRINTFAHVNHTGNNKRLGVLLCINGTGILNRWVKNITGNHASYQEMNNLAEKAEIGSAGLFMLPFGNGAERMLENKKTGAQICNLDLNKHTTAHLYRAAQEGIAFAFRYGLDIMKENKMTPTVIRAGLANMFLSNVFTRSFVNTLQVPVELYNSNGSMGAATGAGLGAGIYSNNKEAVGRVKAISMVVPDEPADRYDELYGGWKRLLEKNLESDSQSSVSAFNTFQLSKQRPTSSS